MNFFNVETPRKNLLRNEEMTLTLAHLQLVEWTIMAILKTDSFAPGPVGPCLATRTNKTNRKRAASSSLHACESQYQNKFIFDILKAVNATHSLMTEHGHSDCKQVNLSGLPTGVVISWSVSFLKFSVFICH